MEIDGVNENAWWTLPENFDSPLVTFIDEAQEEHIFDHEDLHLRCIEVHSNTLIHLERWFTASGETRVTVVGPLRAKRWLMDMIRSVGRQQAYHHKDLHLRRIEVHSNTLIQLERWFTASGQTRVTVVGPLRAKRWLMDMIRSVGSQQAYHQARGEKMLHIVQKQPLTNGDLDDSFSMLAYICGLILDIVFGF